MSLKTIRSVIARNLINLPGWRSKRKIVVIESDDWGSIRMASKQAYNFFIKQGLPVDKCPYNSYDALESNDDIELLFEVLRSVKDVNGNPVVLTANAVMANPDFEKIRESGFQKYYYEPFTKTLERYPEHDRVYRLYKEGINEKLFKPQFHGREHLNVARWMRALQSGDVYALMAFKWNMFSLHSDNHSSCRSEYLDAFAVESNDEMIQLKQIVSSGLDLFHQLMGYHSRTCIAPCYTWHSDMEKIFSEQGVKAIQGIVLQRVPIYGTDGIYKKKYHYLGQSNRLAQHYFVRNCSFEPFQAYETDPVPDCLARIQTAFAWHRPAIISTHRLNFMGFLNPSNREKNLNYLKRLLIAITRRWPDVEFLSSDQLSDLVLADQKMK